MSFNAGNQRLNGAQALAFAREHYNVSGGDFGRAQAQRLVVQGIIKQVLASPPGQLPGLVSSLASSISADLSVTDIVALAQQFQVADLTLYSAVRPSLSRYGRRRELRVPHVQRMARYDVSSRCGPRPNDTTARSPGPVEQLEAGRGKQFAGTKSLRCPGGKCGPYHKRCGS